MLSIIYINNIIHLIMDKKSCKECKEYLSVTLFYRAGKNYQSRCKVCYNAIRRRGERKKRINTLDKLTAQQKVIFEKDYGVISLTKFSRKIDIPYSTLLTLRRRGILPKN